MEPFFTEFRVFLMWSLRVRVMHHQNTSIQEPPALNEWSNWKRRGFIALLCLLELTMISAVVYGVAALWN
jgi:hypothetical protein